MSCSGCNCSCWEAQLSVDQAEQTLLAEETLTNNAAVSLDEEYIANCHCSGAVKGDAEFVPDPILMASLEARKSLIEAWQAANWVRRQQLMKRKAECCGEAKVAP